MLCVWWNFEGVSHWESVSNGRRVNADLHSQKTGTISRNFEMEIPIITYTELDFFCRRKIEAPYGTNTHDKNSGIGKS